MLPILDIAGSLKGVVAEVFAGPSIVWDPSDKTGSSLVLSNGNLTARSDAASQQNCRTTFKLFTTTSGHKVCGQFKIDAVSGASRIEIGLSEKDGAIASAQSGTVAFTWNGGSGISQNGWGEHGSGSISWSVNDTIDWALDCATGKFFLGRNGTWFNSSDPVAGTNPSFDSMPGSGNEFALFVGFISSGGNQVSIVERADVTLSLTGYTKVGGPRSNDAVSDIVFNASDKSGGVTLSNSNYTAAATGSNYENVRSVQGWTTTSAVKVYWEVNIDSVGGSASDLYMGLLNASGTITSGTIYTGIGAGTYAAIRGNSTATLTSGWTGSGTLVTWGAGDRLMFALDTAAGKLWVGKNGTWMNSGDPAAGTNAPFSAMPAGTTWRFFFGSDNIAGDETVSIVKPVDHSYTAPSGFTDI